MRSAERLSELVSAFKAPLEGGMYIKVVCVTEPVAGGRNEFFWNAEFPQSGGATDAKAVSGIGGRVDPDSSAELFERADKG